MAKNSQTLKFLLALQDQAFKKSLKGLKKQLNGFKNFVKSAFALGSITAFGKQMVQVGKDFEDAMARVKAVSNASARDFKAMQKEAQKLGETTRYTASEAANALENLVRNGMSATQATQSLSGVLQLAQANAIGLAEAADIVTNTMNMFGLTVEDTTRINDVLSSTAGSTATNVSLLYEALVNAAPAAKVLGFSLEETSAAIGALAQKGIKGADAGTQLRMSLTKMADPKIIAKMQEMGVAIDEQSMKSDGLLATIKKLKDAQLGLSDLVAIFSQRGAVGMQQLISAYDEFELELEIVKASAGTTARMFNQGVGSVRKELDTLKSAYEGLLINISQKTSGVVRGVIVLLQNLINNFKSVGGSILNIASVAIPLMVGKLAVLGKSFRQLGAEIKLALSTNWIGMLATAVTWAATAVVGAISKTRAAAKALNEEMNNAANESAKMKSAVKSLLDELQPDTDKKSLAGIINELCELFPDFRDYIKDAAIEAGKTGNWEKFKGVLEDIATLQGNVLAKNAQQKIINSTGEKLGKQLQNGTMTTKGAGMYTYQTSEKSFFTQTLDKEIKKAGLQDIANDIYATIGQIIASNGGDLNVAGKQINKYLSGNGIDLNKVPVKLKSDGFGEDHYITDLTDKLYILFNGTSEGKGITFDKSAQALLETIRNAQKNIDALNKEEEDEKERLAAIAAANKKKEEEEEAAAEARKAKLETDEKFAEKKKKIDDAFIKQVGDAQFELKEGWISTAEYQKAYADAVKDAYEALRDLTGERGEGNKYYDRYKDVRTGLEKIDSSNLKGKAEVQNKEKLQKPNLQPLDISEVDFADKFNGIDTALEGINGLTYSLTNLKSAWDVLNDEDATWLEKLMAGVQILNAVSGGLEAFNGLMGISTSLSELFGKSQRKEAMDTVAAKGVEVAATTAAAEAELAANTAVAGAGAAASQAAIPIVGPVLAGSAMASMLASLAATLPKFAKGGVISYGSSSGDKTLARVNKGEGILTADGINNLTKLYNNQGVRGNVEFKIKGSDLVGAINNYQKKIKG